MGEARRIRDFSYAGYQNGLGNELPKADGNVIIERRRFRSPAR